MRRWRFACLLLCNFFATAAHANVICTAAACLAAHDINGIKLDMTIAEVAQLFGGQLQSTGGGYYRARKGDTQYSFIFTPLGHLYHIQSSEELGAFEPDANIAAALTQKLTDKYGRPEMNQLPNGPASWDFIENVTEYGSYGAHYNEFTERLSAMFMPHYQGPTTLELTLADFRINRRDAEKQNTGPSETATSRMHF